MKKTRLITVSAAILFVGLVAGCADLAPVPDVPGIWFCRIDPGNGELFVEVINYGPRDVPATTVTVDFMGFGVSSLPAPPIPAGGTAIVGTFAFPIGCFNPDCDFNIIVDSGDVVVETDENNNVADGYCIG